MLERSAIFRLLLLNGFRSGEICTLKAEDLNAELGIVTILDSKKKCHVSIPQDLETLVMLEKLLRGRRQGYLFQRRHRRRGSRDDPLTVDGLLKHVKRIGLKAGVEGFMPRDFRRHLAAFWLQKAHGDLADLQTILRHTKPQVTWEYANQFVFMDDLSLEKNRVTDLMLQRGDKKMLEMELEVGA